MRFTIFYQCLPQILKNEPALVEALHKNVQALYEGLQKIPNLKVKYPASFRNFVRWFAAIKPLSHAALRHYCIMECFRFFDFQIL